MMESDFLIGRVVLAKAGRDKGRVFIVINRIDDDYVLIANGTGRSIDKPKKKKIKHLDPRPEIAEDIRRKLIKGVKVFDAEINKSLKSFGYEN